MTHESHSRPLPFRKVLVAFLGLAMAGLLWQCSGESTDSSLDEILARSRAAAFFHKDQMSAAREALAPVASSKEASLDVLCDAASIEFASGEYALAEAFLERADKLGSDSPRINYLRGQLLRGQGEFEAALPYFEKTHAALPDDLPTLLCLADVQYGLDQVDEAVNTLEKVVAVGAENGISWYYSAVHRLSRIKIEAGLEDEADRYFTILDDLKKRGLEPPTDTDLSRGNLALALSPEPAGNTERKASPAVQFAAGETLLPELAGARELRVLDLDGDRTLDVLTWSASGVRAAFGGAEGLELGLTLAAPADEVVAFDMDNDGDLDLLLSAFDSCSLLRLDGRSYSPVEDIPIPEFANKVRDAIAVDLDHEGDLDLVIVGEFGLQVWRNDGVASEEGGRFSLMTTPGLELTSPVSSVVAEDLDADQDVDLVCDGRVYSSLRGGRFELLTRLGGPLLGSNTMFTEVNGDALPDAFRHLHSAPVGELEMALTDANGGWTGYGSAANVLADSSLPVATDLNLDGATDVFHGASDGSVHGFLSAGTKHASALQLPLNGVTSPGAFGFGDLDGDGLMDLVASTAEGLVLHRGQGEPVPSFRLTLQGVRDNRFAIGAVVELRSGAHYRRLFWDGVPQRISMGEPRLDILRIIWPNGVLQEDLDLDLVARTSLEQQPEEFGHHEQVAGLVGSCPFLYTWNGETYEFISDVLGITPLGLPMAPGMLVPPDHDEYVLIRGDQLRPKDGVLSIQITEELREVTYLDQLRLHVIDHSSEVTIYPDERFTFPPFPEPHTHTVETTLAAKRVTGSDGKDWTSEVAENDNQHAIPFELYEQQFMGLATPHFLEYEFDAAALKDAEKLRLLMTGWLFWTNASINLASAYHEGVEFVPPILQVPDGQGGWRDAGPPVGFPAGKTKTMVLDVSEILDRDDPRLRVFSTLQLYWDRVVLATDDDSAPLTEQVLEPIAAELWDRGFSRSLENERVDEVERFEWDQLEPRARWNQHPGMYTRYGDVNVLLDEVDDLYCILGTGDSLEVQFDATQLAPVADGMQRDYLLYLDGWAKDRDPNTVEALEVEPLPFHGMSGYPYGEDETFPTDEEHENWRKEWNTRPAKRWIRPLAPQAEARWLLNG